MNIYSNDSSHCSTLKRGVNTMGSRIHISLTVIAAWLIVTGMAAARADTVSCTCTDACGCPDDDTSDTTQPTWCNGATQKNCSCLGISCPTGNGQTCVAVTVCGGQAGPYAPCGGSSTDSCPCGGQDCQNGSGQTCEAKNRCNVATDPYKPCGGNGLKSCVCQGGGCPQEAGKFCEQSNLCNARPGDYKPCGGKEDKYCGCSQGRCQCACTASCNNPNEDNCPCNETPCGNHGCGDAVVRCKKADPYKPCNDESNLCSSQGCGAGENCSCGSYCKGGSSPCGQ